MIPEGSSPCSTLEQRWSACRDQVYSPEQVVWQVVWGAIYDHWSRCCSIDWFDTPRRPCTSPRRKQCRSGGALRTALGVVWTEYAGHQHHCDDELPW